RSQDNVLNHQGVNWDQRYGLPSQSYMPGFEASTNVRSVGVKITNSTANGPGPVTRTVTDADVDAVKVVIGIPSLQKVDKDSGDISGTSVSITIQVRDSAGSGIWENRGTYTINEKS